MKSNFVYLASQSPRRQQLLTQMGIEYRLLLPLSSEDPEAWECVLPRESPTAYVMRVTALKLNAAMSRLRQLNWPSAPILCADTTVALGRTILGKPADPEEARYMLTQLSGHEHRVLTSVAVARGKVVRQALCVSRVRFGHLSPTWIKAYVASGESMGKAGGYAIQGAGGAFVQTVRGSVSSIVGLPLHTVVRLAADLGFVRQAESTTSVARPTRRVRWNVLRVVPTPRHSPTRPSPLGVH